MCTLEGASCVGRPTCVCVVLAPLRRINILYTLGVFSECVAESQHFFFSAENALQDDLLLPSLFTCPLLPTMLMSNGADLDENGPRR